MDMIGDGKTCEEVCKHAPPEKDKWPCMDCDIRFHDRAEQRKDWNLKPCPFCGGEARMMDMGYPHWVYCKTCGARVHGGKYGDEGEQASADAWNRRVTT